MFNLWKQQEREAALRNGHDSQGKGVLSVDPQHTHTSFGERQTQQQHTSRRTVERLRQQVSEAFAPASSCPAPPTAIEGPGEKMFPQKSLSVGVGDKDSSVSDDGGGGDGGGGARSGMATTCEEKPRRPWSSYNFFFREERVKMLKESKKAAAADLTNSYSKSGSANKGEGGADEEQQAKEQKSANEKEPTRPLGAVSFQELGKIIGRKWRSADPETLAKYKELAKQDSMRYRREMEEYYERQEALLNSYTGKLVVKGGDSQDAAPPSPPVASQAPAISREPHHDPHHGQGSDARKRPVDQLYLRDMSSHPRDEESVITKGLVSMSDPLRLPLPRGNAWRDADALGMSRSYPTIPDSVLQQAYSANRAAELRASRDLLALNADVRHRQQCAIEDAYGQLARQASLRESSHLEAIRNERHLPPSATGVGYPPSLLHPSVRDLFCSTSVGFQGWSAGEIDALIGEVALRQRRESERLLLRRQTAATADAMTRHLLEQFRRPGSLNPTMADRQLGGGGPLDPMRAANALRSLQSGIPTTFDRGPIPDALRSLQSRIPTTYDRGPIPDASPGTDPACTDGYGAPGFRRDPSSYHRRDDDYDSEAPRKYARGA